MEDNLICEMAPKGLTISPMVILTRGRYRVKTINRH